MVFPNFLTLGVHSSHHALTQSHGGLCFSPHCCPGCQELGDTASLKGGSTTVSGVFSLATDSWSASFDVQWHQGTDNKAVDGSDNKVPTSACLTYRLRHILGFPGGAVVKNPPVNAGDMGSSPGPGRPTCRGATKPVCHNYWACALEPASHNYWSPRVTTTEACAPRARAPQQEKPPQWEARAPQRRVDPARRN